MNLIQQNTLESELNKACAIDPGLRRVIEDVGYPDPRPGTPGFATLAILGFFNIGVVSMFLGILGEYFIRVIEQVTIGPISIVERHVNLPDDRMQRHAQILIV